MMVHCAAAVLLPGTAQIGVLALGMALDFPCLMPLDLWRSAVLELPGLGPYPLAALLDSPVLIPQLATLLPAFRFVVGTR